MDPALKHSHIEKIKELIEDEDEIVTLPYLAKTLHTSIQDSQKLIEEYVNQEKSKNTVAVTYVLSGLLKNDKGNSKEKSTETSKPKPSNGITNLFHKAQASNSIQDSIKKESTDAGKNKVAKKGISGFLTKVPSKDSVKSEKPNSNSQEGERFLTKAASKDSVESQEQESSSKKVKKEEIPMDVEEVNEIKEEQVEKPSKKESKAKKSKPKSKRQREDSAEKITKRRKRIVERVDSESDDMFEKDDEEDIIEKSDGEPEIAPPIISKKPLEAKNKRRKAVDRTYEDEDGYIVTKTEYVYETASEDENEVPVKNIMEEKPKIKAADKKSSVSSENDTSPLKGAKGKKGKKNNMQNQPTLMNFFKKK
ncbi:hypothetical protein JTB14_032294 [Gonioctena quinquepunctata]|nr:hypothetical protein JTB14_032294 [Gonioctena quinquepunctata]